MDTTPHWGHITCSILFFAVLAFRYVLSVIQLRFHYPSIVTLQFWRELYDILFNSKGPITTQSTVIYAPPFGDLESGSFGRTVAIKVSLLWTHFQKNQHKAIQARDPLVFLINYVFTLVSLIVYTYIPIKLLVWNAARIVSLQDGLEVVSVAQSEEEGINEVTAAQVLDCYAHSYIFPFFIAFLMAITVVCIITGTIYIWFFKEPEIVNNEEINDDETVIEDEERMKNIFVPKSEYELKDYTRQENEQDETCSSSEEDKDHTYTDEITQDEQSQEEEEEEDTITQIDDSSLEERQIQETQNVSISVNEKVAPPSTTWYFINGFSKTTLLIFGVTMFVAVASFAGSLANRIDSCSQLIDKESPGPYVFGELLDWWLWGVLAFVNVICFVAMITVFALRYRRERERTIRGDLRKRELQNIAPASEASLTKPTIAVRTPTIEVVVQHAPTQAKDWLRTLYQLDPHDFRFDLLGLWTFSTFYLVYNSPLTHQIRSMLQDGGGLFGALLISNFSHLILNLIVQFVPITARAWRKSQSTELISLGTDNEEQEKDDDFEYKDPGVMHDPALSDIVSAYNRSLKIPIFLVLFEEYAQSQSNLLPLVVYIWRFVDQLERKIYRLKKKNKQIDILELRAQVDKFITFIEDNECLQGYDLAIKTLLSEIKQIVHVNELDWTIEKQSGDNAQKEIDDTKEVMKRLCLIVRHNLYNSQEFYSEFRDRVCCVELAKKTGFNTNNVF
jgi:hypothetical protein